MAGSKLGRASPQSRRSYGSRRKTLRSVFRNRAWFPLPPGRGHERGAGVPIFVYKAADQRGQTIDGVMEAADARGVVERLQHDAYFPIKISPQTERRSVLGISWPGLGRGRISRREV